MAMKTLVTALLLTGTAAVAQQPAATTVQQDFDRATALSNGPDKPAALAAWQALERRVADNKRNVGIVLVRESDVLFDLDHKDQAIAAAREGLADLPAADRTLDDDRYEAYRNLGEVAEAALDYAGAVESYRQAMTFAKSPAAKLGVLRGLIQAEIFTDTDAAAGDLDRADAALAQIKVDRSVHAMFEKLHGIYLLAKGDFKGGQKMESHAVEDLGGLTTMTKLDDVEARSDYAIAALLAGDTDEARHYMAYTGAGRLPKGSFDPAVQMKVPECGGEAGLKPDDAAVVQFSIGDTGAVIASEPIYAAGGGQAALAFARAAHEWSWTPEQVKQMPTFFRYDARVELRCSTSFEHPSLETYLDQELGAWLATKNITLAPPIVGADAVVLPRLRARLDAEQTANGPDALVLVPTLVAIAENSVSGREESNRLATRALQIVEANGATPLARLAVEHLTWETAKAETWRATTFRDLVAPHLQDPAYANDPEARAVIRLMLADALRRHSTDDARGLDQQVADDTALAANSPLKVGALIRLASLDAADGKVQAAQVAFARSGLSADQCALLDSPPQRVSANVRSDAFPQEARRWGFEGWTRIQFNINANGKVESPRAILSYPPFVFTEAGTDVIDGARYEKSYRPDGGLGCSGETAGVRFQLGF